MSPKIKRAAKPQKALPKFKDDTEFIVNLRGRPTKYRTEYGPMLVEYCRGGGFIEGFADSICVHHDTILHWSKIYPDFSRFYRLAKQAQKAVLMKLAIAGATGRFAKFNAPSVIFLMKAIHGMRDDGLDGAEDSDMDFDFGDEAVTVEPKNDK